MIICLAVGIYRRILVRLPCYGVRKDCASKPKEQSALANDETPTRFITMLLPDFLAKLIFQEREHFQLDLQGRTVLTEAATGAYAATAALAGLAGANVIAVARESAYGSISQIDEELGSLAEMLGIADRLKIIECLGHDDIARADIITNSGHVRPIHRSFVEAMHPDAVVPLMYEAWELRSEDVAVDACRERGIRVAGTNERHPKVRVFDYLGLVVFKAILDSGAWFYGAECLVVCDNDFGSYIVACLKSNGAEVCCVSRPEDVHRSNWDIVIIATTPPSAGGAPVRLDGLRANLYCQLWGDVEDRDEYGPWMPAAEPKKGHMGLLLTTVGAAPVVRLQAAGLKCAQLMLDGESGEFAGLVQWVVRRWNTGQAEAR